MKKISILFFLFTVTVSSFAQGNPKAFEGAWQFMAMSVNNGHATPVPVPIFKVFQSDGTYIIINNIRNSHTLLNSKGTWKVTSDSTYVEHVENASALADKFLIGKDITLDYSFSDNGKQIITKFLVPGADRKNSELWRKVEILDQEEKQVDRISL